MCRRSPTSAAALALAAWLAACASGTAAGPGPRTIPQGTLWVRSAAEYGALARQAYAVATAALDEALADPTWTAALEQDGDPGGLLPAVVLDVDETALDNAGYGLRIAARGAAFSPASWAAWVEEAAAPPVPGAVAFAREAAAKGVAVFYVTNRDAPLEAATRRNLEAVGFPVAAEGDVVLTRGERPDWTSDKASRRAWVAAGHRILLLVGDDLNDFVPADLSRAERDALVRRHADRWGRRWIVLPNPMYGSWEAALREEGEGP